MSQVHTSTSLLSFWETVKQMFLLSSVTPAMPDQNKPMPSDQDKKKQEEEEQQQIRPL